MLFNRMIYLIERSDMREDYDYIGHNLSTYIKHLDNFDSLSYWVKYSVFKISDSYFRYGKGIQFIFSGNYDSLIEFVKSIEPVESVESKQ